MIDLPDGLHTFSVDGALSELRFQTRLAAQVKAHETALLRVRIGDVPSDATEAIEIDALDTPLVGFDVVLAHVLAVA